MGFDAVCPDSLLLFHNAFSNLLHLEPTNAHATGEAHHPSPR